MWCRTLKNRLLYCLLLLPLLGNAQVSADCSGAIILCSDTTVLITGNSTGEPDFADSDNDPGCLETIETRGRWFYFEFEDNMPANSSLEFVLTALEAFPPDYDFALYGPNLSCDSLGHPVRCSPGLSPGPPPAWPVGIRILRRPLTPMVSWRHCRFSRAKAITFL